MPRLGLRLQLQRHVTFLGNAHQRHRTIKAQGAARQHHAALVQDQGKLQALLFQPGGNLHCALAATDFLIVAECQIHIAGGSLVVLQQCFSGFQDRHQAALVIQGAAPPDKVVIYYSGKRWVLPLFRGRHRHHILMGQQQLWRAIVVAIPVIRQTMAEGFQGKGLVGQRKAGAQKIMEAHKGIGLLRQRRKTQGGGQSFHHGVLVHGLVQFGQVGNAVIRLRQCQGVIEQDCEQNEYGQYQKLQQAFHVFLPILCVVVVTLPGW